MPLKTIFFLSLVALLSSQPAARSQASTAPQAQSDQAADDEAKIRADAAKTVQATINWDKSGTPGTRARLELIKKGIVGGKPVLDYRLKVDGAARDKRYKLFVWPVMVADPIQMMDGLAVGNDGTVLCPADSPGDCVKRFKGTEVHLTYAPELGEIYRHALISEDKQSRVFFSVVPSPVTETNKSCSLEAVRLSPSFELALIHGKGFKPGEELSLHTQSYQEVHNEAAKADAQGEFYLSITPAVKGRTSGVIEITAKSASCAPMISFNWGL